MSARYIDIHVLHTLPYANLNRDDLGAPKTVRFGYAERTRVSSQCWKRAVRKKLEEVNDPAVRTRRIPAEVTKGLRAAGWDDELATFAGQQVAAAAADGLAVDKGETSVLLYLPASSLDEMAAICVEHRDVLAEAQAGKRKLKKNESLLPRDRVNALLSGRTATINLFGRMLAELPSSNVDGAVQMAHAFTVHGTDPEIDFFTAVDDIKDQADEQGSGHLNSALFSAGTFYRYASVNVADLLSNLRSDPSVDRPEAIATDLIRDFLSAFITAMPEGKRTATAPFTVPDLVYISVRADRPVSLANAFEQPVRAAGGGYAAPARTALNDYAEKIYRLLGRRGIVHHAHTSVDDKPLEALGEAVDSYDDVVSQAVARITAK